MSQHTAKALATMKGIRVKGRWILDGACTAMSACELKMFDKSTLEKPGPEVRPLQAAEGTICEVQFTGSVPLIIKHDKGQWRKMIHDVRYTPELSVNLFPESVIHELGCSIEWPDGGRKQITLPDGGVCTLKFEHGLHFLEHDDAERAFAGIETLDQRQAKRDGSQFKKIDLDDHERIDAELVHNDDEEGDKKSNEERGEDIQIKPEVLSSNTFTTKNSTANQSRWVAGERRKGRVSPRATAKVKSLHELMGHPGAKALIQAVEAHGFELTKEERDALKQLYCDACATGKHVRSSIAKSAPTPKPTRCGVKVSTDVVGPFQNGVGGVRYAWIFIDWYSKMPFVYPVHHKSEFLSAFQQYLVDAGRWKDGKAQLEVLQSDTASEVYCEESKQFARENGIKLRAGPPHEQGKNGLIERHWRVLKSKLITTLFDTGAPKKFWNYLLQHVAVQQSLTPITGTGELPYTRQFQYKPDFKKLLPCPWGTVGTAINWSGRVALDPPARVGIYIGNSYRSQPARVWCPDKDSVIEAYSFRQSKNADGT